MWWVNQGSTYGKEREGGFIWAPMLNKANRPQRHWDAMDEVQRDDIILHYSGGFLCAASVAQGTARPEVRLPGIGQAGTLRDPVRRRRLVFEADDIRDWQNKNVVDRDGDKIGSLEGLYYDTATQHPTFASVQVGIPCPSAV